MLEIIFIAYFSGKIANIAEDSGYKKGPYRALAVILWIVGEFLGLLIGFAIVGGIGAYVIGLLGAVSGALTSYLIVKGLPDKTLNPQDGSFSETWVCRYCGYNNTSFDKGKCFQCRKPREV